MSSNPNPDDKVTVEGQAILWTDEQIAAMCAITPAVLADARADARRDPTLAALLNARIVDQGEEGTANG